MNTMNINDKIEESLYYMQNDTLKAIEILDEVLEIEPENLDAINAKGSSLMKLNKMQDAEKYFDRSLSIKKTSSALINKGIISKGKKNYIKSLYYYNKAIQLNPDLNNIITLLKNEIIGLMKDEIDLKNYDSRANELIKQGIACENSNKLQDALNYYKKAIEIDRTCVNSLDRHINEIESILHNEL